ncbi:MAG: hypothetical protein ACK5NK_06545 [Niabella sp.]
MDLYIINGVKRMLFIKYFFVLIFVFCFHQAKTQTALVKASADKDTILLGEPFWLTLEIRAPRNSTITPFKIDSIPHFEFLQKDSIIKSEEEGAILIRQYYQLTSFDSGQWVIPQFQLRPYVKTNSLLVNVVFTRPFDPAQPYHDIQDIQTVPINKSRLLLWLALSLAGLLLLVIIIYFITQKRLKFLPQKPMEPPYEEAKKEIAFLRKGDNDEKVFYEGLVSVFRNYVRRRTGIDSLQQTTNDLVQKLKPLYADETDAVKYSSLEQVLFQSDLVKFAKYNPDDNDAISAYEVVDQAIDHIEDKALNKSAAVSKNATKVNGTKGGGL